MQAVSVDRRDRLLDLVSDLVLFLCLFTNVALQHTVWSSAGLLLLFGAAFVRFCVRPRIYGSVWYLGYGLLIVWGLIGALAGWALDRATALSMCKTLLIDLAFVFSVHQLIVQRRDIERSLLVFLAVCTALLIYVLIRDAKTLLNDRLNLPSGINANDMAMTLCVGYAIAFHRLYSGFVHKDSCRILWSHQIPLLVLLVLFSILVLMTGSRKGLMLLVLLPAGYLLWRDRAHIKRNLFIVAVACILLLVSIFFIPKLYTLIGNRIVRLFQAMLSGDLSIEGSYAERLQFIRKGLEMISERPFTGWGLDCFRLNGVTRETYSHCNYVELLVSGGIPALLCYYAPLCVVLVRIVRRAANQPVLQLVAMLTISSVIMDIMSVTYFERPRLMEIALLLGALRLFDGFARRGERDGTALLRYIKNPFRLFLPFAMRGCFNRMPDERYLKCLYRAMFGKKLDLLCPSGFNEKLNWMKLYDRDMRYPRLADKYAMRSVVQERVGEGHLVPLLGVWSDADAIDFSTLPVPCVLKTTHDSGGVYVLTKGDPAACEKARAFLKRHLARNYALLWREWPYSRVQPRVIAEAFIGGPDGSLPVDYKIQCFDGRAFAVLVRTRREIGNWYFDRGGAPLPVTRFMESNMERAKSVPLPSLTEMVRIAESCSAGYRELRVDLYLTPDGGIKVGEMTLFHDAGFFEDYTEAGDRLLGEQLRLGEQRYAGDQRSPGDRRYPGKQPNPGDRRYAVNPRAPGNLRTPGNLRSTGGQPTPGNQPQPAELSNPADQSQSGDQPDPGATSEATHGA